MSEGPVLTFVYCVGDPQCDRMARMLPAVTRANRRAGLQLEALDLDRNTKRARQLGVLEYPAAILHVDGVERGRFVGAQSHRGLLQTLLPVLYPDPEEALAQLRRQLDSPGEEFPRRALKRSDRLNRGARMAMLADVPLFASLSKRALTQVAAAADEVVVEAGAALIEEDQPGDAFYVVATGSMSVRRRGRKMESIGPGDCVGEIALLDGGPRTATVVAEERTVLLGLERELFETVLRRNPDLALDLLRVVSTRLRAADKRLTA